MERINEKTKDLKEPSEIQQGYPTEIFLTSDIITDFLCPICLNVLNNPMVDEC